jgi:hypothetical protein
VNSFSPPIFWSQSETTGTAFQWRLITISNHVLQKGEDFSFHSKEYAEKNVQAKAVKISLGLSISVLQMYEIRYLT